MDPFTRATDANITSDLLMCGYAMHGNLHVVRHSFIHTHPRVEEYDTDDMNPPITQVIGLPDSSCIAQPSTHGKKKYFCMNVYHIDNRYEVSGSGVGIGGAHSTADTSGHSFKLERPTPRKEEACEFGGPRCVV